MFDREDFDPESIEEMRKWPWQLRWGILLATLSFLGLIMLVAWLLGR